MASATGRSVPGRIARWRSACLRELRRARIDDDQLGAEALGLADVRHQVNAGRGRIRAPDDDQACLAEVEVGDRRHLSVHRRRWRHRSPRRRPSAPDATRPAGGTASHRWCPASAVRSSRRRNTAGSTRRPNAPRASRMRSAMSRQRLIPRSRARSGRGPSGPSGWPDRAVDPARRRVRGNSRTLAQM